MSEKIRLKTKQNEELELSLSKSFNKGKIGTDKMIYQSLKQNGCGRGILVDSDNNVISGNKTIKAAKELGMRIKIVECDADELVVVKRNDVNLDSKKGYELALLDNLIVSKTLEWDTNEILKIMDRIISFDPRLWNGYECVVKELDISSLVKDEIQTNQNTRHIKTDYNTDTIQLTLF